MRVRKESGDLVAGQEVRASGVVKSADRTIDLLELLADCAEPPTFMQIGAALGIPKSSLSQLLGNLVRRGYLEFDAGQGRYRLGERVARLARRAAASVPFRQVLTRSLERLRDVMNESVAFYIRHGDDVEVIAAVTSRHALAYTMTIGDRAPLYAMSAGKVVLGYLSQDELDDYLGRVRPQALTPHTIRTKTALRTEAASIRRTGIAFACEEFQLGIRGAAVPVWVDGRLFGSLNVAVPVSRYNDRLDVALREALPTTAADISAVLSRYDPSSLDAIVSELTAAD